MDAIQQPRPTLAPIQSVRRGQCNTLSPHSMRKLITESQQARNSPQSGSRTSLASTSRSTSSNRPSSHAPAHARSKSFANTVPHTRDCQSIAGGGTEPSRRKTLAVRSLFNGSSAPINIGILPSPQREEADMDFYASQSLRTSSKTKVNASTQSFASRFAWFGARPATPPPKPVRDDIAEDKLLTLDIQTALFPRGPADPLDPSSFHDLLFNAESIISQMQAGYRRKTEALLDMAADTEVRQEEFEEVQTRARHLKLQLDNMAARVAEQEDAMKALADELALEKQLREQEYAAQKQTVRLVPAPLASSDITDQHSHHYRKRVYDGSIASNSDSGFESGDDSFAESALSPTSEMPSPSIDVMSSNRESTTSHAAPRKPRVLVKAPPPVKRHSMFQRSLESEPVFGQGELLYTSNRSSLQCFNAASDVGAWSLISGLREENSELRQRVTELETAVEGCLDLVAA